MTVICHGPDVFLEAALSISTIFVLFPIRVTIAPLPSFAPRLVSSPSLRNRFSLSAFRGAFMDTYRQGVPDFCGSGRASWSVCYFILLPAMSAKFPPLRQTDCVLYMRVRGKYSATAFHVRPEICSGDQSSSFKAGPKLPDDTGSFVRLAFGFVFCVPIPCFESLVPQIVCLSLSSCGLISRLSVEF